MNISQNNSLSIFDISNYNDISRVDIFNCNLSQKFFPKFTIFPDIENFWKIQTYIYYQINYKKLNYKVSLIPGHILRLHFWDARAGPKCMQSSPP